MMTSAPAPASSLNDPQLIPAPYLPTGPYSQFRVGAALLIHPSSASSSSSSSPEIILGANVENAAYPVGTCAERVAVGTAVATFGYGRGDIKAVGVATDLPDDYCSPCGMCRQFLREFLEVRAMSRSFAREYCTLLSAELSG